MRCGFTARVMGCWRINHQLHLIKLMQWVVGGWRIAAMCQGRPAFKPVLLLTAAASHILFNAQPSAFERGHQLSPIA